MVKIMIVDDALFMRTLLKKALSAGDFTLVEGANGQEAVSLYEQERPDLVLMDITMPEMDGIAATTAISHSDPSAKVIICSALGQQQMVIEAFSAGAKDYITKPFQPNQVLEAVNRNLAGASGGAEGVKQSA
jgi:two-component system, chemotaxis family, chemotaxis protein CheY